MKNEDEKEKTYEIEYINAKSCRITCKKKKSELGKSVINLERFSVN